MPRFDPIYTNFSAGELSPFMTARVDLEKYNSGCEILENFIPRPHGPAVRRGGTRFIAKAKFNDKVCRLIPFDTGVETGLFHLEFGDGYIRFFTQDVQLENPPGTPYEVSTTYLESELFEIVYLQDANTLYLFHEKHPPAQLVRNDTYDWVLSDIVFTSPPAEWTVDNYPGVGTFYEQRLLLGGTPLQPSTIWGSKIGAYTDFTKGTAQDDDAFEYTVYTDKINLIQWMSSGEVLAIGTSGGEYRMMSTSFNETITPANVKIVRQSNYGSARVLPIRIANRVLFLQKGLLKVRNFIFEADIYRSEDVTMLSEHISQPGFYEADYQNEPDSIAWYMRQDGQLVGMTYEPEYNVIGWFRIVTDGAFESISVTDGYADKRYDDIYVSVKRTVLGADVRYIEKLEQPLAREDVIENAFYVDSGLSYSGAPISVFAGLDHLEGRTVQILADGAVHPDQVVQSGEIALQYSASVVHAGLGFDSTLQTMRVEGGNPIGTSQGKIKRIKEVDIRVYRTVGIVVNGERIYMGPPDNMNQPIQPYSGDLKAKIDDGYETAGQITIVQNQPLPMTIMGIMPEIRTS